MTPLRRDDTPAIRRRYGAGAWAEWQRVCAHVALNEGFALVVLLVPDRDGSALCRLTLGNRLRVAGQGILDASPANPSALRQLAPTLLSLRPPEDRTVVWVSAPVPPSARDHGAWFMAWRWGLATLNQNRNPLRRWFGRSLVIVATPDLVPMFREAAPDLWSVRSLVAHILPDPAGSPPLPPDRWNAPRRLDHGSAPDLIDALRQVERLRRHPPDQSMADAVEQAARAYARRGDIAAAEACFREALDLRHRLGPAAAAAATRRHLAELLLDQGHAAEAIDQLREALPLMADAPPAQRAPVADTLAHALLAQGRAEEAELWFGQALELAAGAGTAALAVGISTDMLARAILAQGRAPEAEAVFRDAVALIERAGAPPASLGVTLEMLAHAVLAQGRAAEAAAILRRSLALAEAGGASAVSRAVTTRTLAKAALVRGRRTEAEALLRGAIELARDGGAPDDLIRILAAD